MRLVRRLVLLAVLLALAYPLWLGFLVWEQSRQDELHSADAIVVLGAAQYNGDPSPVFKARLDHATYLYTEGFSNTIVVTGGKQQGDSFTEAEVGHSYLEGEGVPAERILEETQGRTTLQSLRNVKEIANEQGIETALLVSDPLHSERIKRMASDLGFEEVYASWASYERLDRSRETKVRELLHEVTALLAYEFLNR